MNHKTFAVQTLGVAPEHYDAMNTKPHAMLKIKVRGDANAQALFDTCHGLGVTWSSQHGGWHTLHIERPGVDLPAHLRSCFPEMRFACIEA